MKGTFNNFFIGSSKDAMSARVFIAGCPLDMTSSFRPGTRFAPDDIRKASWTLETYSPYLDSDLDDAGFFDAGNLDLPPGNLDQALLVIENASKETAGSKRKLLALGGEHLVTYPLIKGLRNHIEKLQVVHFDAHCDLRDNYEGEVLSHATALKLVKNLGGVDLFQIGIRSGTRQEFKELNLINSPVSLETSIDPHIPVYVTFDLDVCDPSLAPGVTTPEPGGLTFKEVMEYFIVLSKFALIGADVVELAPDYDTTFVSSIVAAKITRELILLLALNQAM
jgi:agmatinase